MRLWVNFIIFIMMSIGLSDMAVASSPLRIVAAENFYGDIAEQIGGRFVHVTSIMSNPNQDPHLFSATPATGEALSTANIVIYNGIGYDSWLPQLLSANVHQPVKVLVVAQLLQKKIGDNPHIWYDPKTMPVLASDLAKTLTQLMPAEAQYFSARLQQFNDHFTPITTAVAQLKAQYKNTPILATEPVFNAMAGALGLQVYGQAFQLSIMNDSEPSATSILDFEQKMTQHQAKLLIYNQQVVDPLTERMKQLALQNHIPIVGVNEMQPLTMSYQQWMLTTLATLRTTLAHVGSPRM